MRISRNFIYLVLILIILLTGCSAGTDQPLPPTSLPLSDPRSNDLQVPEGVVKLDHPIYLPEGFQIQIFAAGLNSPSMLAFGPDQSLYVSETGSGRILRLPDHDQDGFADDLEIAAEGFIEPSGLAFYQDGSLYAAETTRVFRLTDQDGDGFFEERETLISGLPAGGNTNRTIIFNPDWSRLFLSVGSSCNACVEQNEQRASILLYRPDGSFIQTYTRGIRYVIGLDFHPIWEQLWAAGIERSDLAEGLPPDTIYILNIDTDAGWPSCHAGRIADPDFGKGNACDEDLLTPVFELEALTNPSGIEFYQGDLFPEVYLTDLFIALHGSGEGRSAVGFKVIRIPLGDGSSSPPEDFAVGWLLEDGTHWGTPMDLIEGPSGDLYLSDDFAGVIYRIFYDG